MKKSIVMIVGAIVLAVLIGAGGFMGGMAYQSNQANQVRDNFMRSRGLDPNAVPGEGQIMPFEQENNGAQGRAFFGGGTTGQVKSVEGNVLTLSTAQNVTTVNLTDTTQIEKADTVTTSDLQPGERVFVMGERDSEGNITASQILIFKSIFIASGTNPVTNQGTNP